MHIGIHMYAHIHTLNVCTYLCFNGVAVQGDKN